MATDEQTKALELIKDMEIRFHIFKMGLIIFCSAVIVLIMLWESSRVIKQQNYNSLLGRRQISCIITAASAGNQTAVKKQVDVCQSTYGGL